MDITQNLKLELEQCKRLLRKTCTENVRKRLEEAMEQIRAEIAQEETDALVRRYRKSLL
jgi:hypothetical protein